MTNEVQAQIAALAKEMERINRELILLREGSDAQGDAIGRLAKGLPGDAPATEGTSDFVLWSCKSCGAKLGVYAKGPNEVRIKSRDRYLWFHPGPGGWITVTCVTCGDLNSANEPA